MYKNKKEKTDLIKTIKKNQKANDTDTKRSGTPKKNTQKQYAQKKLTEKRLAQKQPTHTKSGQKMSEHKQAGCPLAKKCGGCQLQGMAYEKQLEKKREIVKKELNGVKVLPVIGMKNPYHYRNKVHAAFGRLRNGTIISGVYEQGTHRIVPVEQCEIQDERADAMIATIRELAKSFKLRIYDEDTGYGALRHVLIRTGHATGEVLVVLVLATPILPSKNNFVKALLKAHPQITSVVLNVNDRHTSMVLGERNIVLYGKGYIEDVLCGNRYRISPNSFYQVNPLQTKVLYEKAISYAKLTGKETVIDAYCGIGTIGMTAASAAGKVIGVEQNASAVRDARMNAKMNGCKNISFIEADATEYLSRLAEDPKHEKIDIVLMDPPRSGSTEQFMRAAASLGPKRIVYVSCNPTTLGRDLKYFAKLGYRAKECQPVDMFPFTDDVETVVCLIPV